MTDDLLTSDEVRAILRVERTALARYLVGPDRIPHLRLGNPRTGPLRIRRSALEEWIRRREEETGDREAGLSDRLGVPEEERREVDRKHPGRPRRPRPLRDGHRPGGRDEAPGEGAELDDFTPRAIHGDGRVVPRKVA